MRDRVRATRRRGEEGAVAIFLALTMCFVVIPLAGLALDIGSQRIARADIQTVADLTATDMARLLGSGGTPTDALATASSQRDLGVVGSAPTVNVYLGHISDSATFVSSQSRGCGSSPYDAYFASVTPGVPANAVVVTATNKVSFVFESGSGGACRSALARVNGTACFALGSYAARVNSEGSTVLAPLNKIFGLNLSLLSYQNIAGAHVTLAQLAANARFGTATQLLTGSIKVSDLVLAMIEVLQAQDPTGNAAVIAALNGMVTATSTLPAITLLNLLHISPTDTAALATKFDVLDLVTGSVLLANGQHAITIPNLWAGVAGTGSTTDAKLYIQQGASTACGAPGSSQAVAQNSQFSGYVNFDQMNSPSINIGIANFKTGVGTGQFTINVAPAQGQLISPPAPVCGAGTALNPTTFSVQVSSALASVQLLTKVPVTGNVTVAGLGSVSLNLTVDVTVGTVKPTGSSIANLSIPPNDVTPVVTGSSVRLNPVTAVITVDPASSATVLGPLGVWLPLSLSDPVVAPLLAPTLTAILGGMNDHFIPSTINPLVANLNSLLTGPLADLLGLDIGGADVYAINAVCNLPTLAG